MKYAGWLHNNAGPQVFQAAIDGQVIVRDNASVNASKKRNALFVLRCDYQKTTGLHKDWEILIENWNAPRWEGNIGSCRLMIRDIYVVAVMKVRR